MVYIALKPCNFAGQKFRIGDSIPAELIQQGSVKNLIQMGKIAAPDGQIPVVRVETPSAPTKTEILVHAAEGDVALELTKEGLQLVFDVLTAKADEAEKIIKTIEDGDALILLHVVDSRKSIKAAAEDRAKSLEAEEDAKEEVTEEGDQ